MKISFFNRYSEILYQNGFASSIVPLGLFLLEKDKKEIKDITTQSISGTDWNKAQVSIKCLQYNGNRLMIPYCPLSKLMIPDKINYKTKE